MPLLKPLQVLLNPVVLVSLGFHGILLMLPVDIAEPEVAKPNLQPIQLTSLPPKAAVTPQPVPQKQQVAVNQKPAVSPQPVAVQPVPAPIAARTPAPTPSPLVRRSPQSPVVQASPPVTQVKQSPQTPEPDLQLPTPQPSNPVASPSPPLPTGLGLTEISGVPVDPNWQGVNAPAQALDEPELLLGSDPASSQIHPNIVGQIVKAPGGTPDEVFEKFYQNQLETAQFQVEPMGAYFAGGGLYRLSRQDLKAPLYLALAPAKDNSGTIVTVWNQYPQPISE